MSPFLSIILVIEEKVRWDVEATKQNVALDNCPHMHSPTQPGKYLEQLKAYMADFKSELLFTFKKLKFTYKASSKSINFYLSYQMLKLLRYSSVFLKVISFHICKRSTFQSSNSRGLDFREKKTHLLNDTRYCLEPIYGYGSNTIDTIFFMLTNL